MTETTEITAEDFRGILGEKLKKYPEAIPFVVELVCCHGGERLYIPVSTKALKKKVQELFPFI